MQGDRGDIVLGWLTKLVVILGALGLVGFDLIAVGQGHLQATDRADTAARAAAENYQTSRNTQQAFDAAYATLVDGDTIEPSTFAVTPAGAVALRLHHEVTTLLVEKIGPLRDRASIVAAGTAAPAR